MKKMLTVEKQLLTLSAISSQGESVDKDVNDKEFDGEARLLRNSIGVCRSTIYDSPEMNEEKDSFKNTPIDGVLAQLTYVSKASEANIMEKKGNASVDIVEEDKKTTGVVREDVDELSTKFSKVSVTAEEQKREHGQYNNISSLADQLDSLKLQVSVKERGIKMTEESSEVLPEKSSVQKNIAQSSSGSSMGYVSRHPTGLQTGFGTQNASVNLFDQVNPFLSQAFAETAKRFLREQQITEERMAAMIPIANSCFSNKRAADECHIQTTKVLRQPVVHDERSAISQEALTVEYRPDLQGATWGQSTAYGGEFISQPQQSLEPNANRITSLQSVKRGELPSQDQYLSPANDCFLAKSNTEADSSQLEEACLNSILANDFGWPHQPNLSYCLYGQQPAGPCSPLSSSQDSNGINRFYSNVLSPADSGYSTISENASPPSSNAFALGPYPNHQSPFSDCADPRTRNRESIDSGLDVSLDTLTGSLDSPPDSLYRDYPMGKSDPLMGHLVDRLLAGPLGSLTYSSVANEPGFLDTINEFLEEKNDLCCAAGPPSLPSSTMTSMAQISGIASLCTLSIGTGDVIIGVTLPSSVGANKTVSVSASQKCRPLLPKPAPEAAPPVPKNVSPKNQAVPIPKLSPASQAILSPASAVPMQPQPTCLLPVTVAEQRSEMTMGRTQPPLPPRNKRPTIQRTKARTGIYKLTPKQMFFVDANGNTFLHKCILYDNVDWLEEYLCRARRDQILPSVVDRKDSAGRTPLFCASLGNRTRIVEMLLVFGANVNHLSLFACSTRTIECAAVHVAASGGSEMLDLLAILLRAPRIDVNLNNSDDEVALHCAIKAHDQLRRDGTRVDSRRTIRLLLEKNANLNAQAKDGKTLLFFVVEKGSSAFLEFFLGCISNALLPDAINHRMSNDITCLRVAHELRNVHEQEKARIIELLKSNGAAEEGRAKLQATRRRKETTPSKQAKQKPIGQQLDSPNLQLYKPDYLYEVTETLRQFYEIFPDFNHGTSVTFNLPSTVTNEFSTINTEAFEGP